MTHYGLKRRMRKRALETVRRKRRENDPTYWRFGQVSGASNIAQAQALCVNCGKPGRHFVPPSMGEEGFFSCDPTRVSGSATVERLVQSGERKRDLHSKSITALRKEGARLKIKGCWSMRKAPLVEAILEAESVSA